MYVSAGEIDRAKTSPEIIADEFTRFHELQRHYGKDYADTGLFVERSSHHRVQAALRDMGGMAITTRLGIPEGGRLTVPLSSAVELSTHVYYGLSQVRSIVLAARLDGRSEDRENRIVFPRDGDFDELVQVGMGVNLQDRNVGYAVSLRSIRKGEDIQTSATRMVFKGSRMGDIVAKKVVKIIPEDLQKDFLQSFRDAAWESVSEPA